MDRIKNNWIYFFLLIFCISSSDLLKAEGTPSFWKNYGGLALADESGGYALTFVSDPALGLFPGSSYESDSLNRVYINIADHTSENINLGFNVRRISMLSCDNYPQETFVDYTAANLPANHRVHWRLKDPNGNVVDSSGTTGIPYWNGGTTTSTTAGFIGSYAEAVAGPDGVSGVTTAGYTPEVFNPTMNGDYYIEFNYGDVDTVFDNSGCTFALVEFAYMDMTVSDGSSDAINGRVWSRLWPLTTHNRQANQAITINSSKFHIYTDDSIITRIDFDTLSPGYWNVFANNEGVGSSGTFELDVRSDVSPATALPRKNRVFLNTPDTNVYPTRPLTRTRSPLYVMKCGPGDQCIMVDINRASDLNIYIEVNGIEAYQVGSTDVLISNVFAPKGLSCITWDGLDGLGNPLTVGDTFYIQVLFESGVTQLPLRDIESNPNGLKINLELPISGRTAAYWNDSLVGGGLNLAGCLSSATVGCHDWTGTFSSGIGNGNIINTYWYSTLDTLVPTTFSDVTFSIDIVQDTIDAACAKRDTVSPGQINITAFNGPVDKDFRWQTAGGGTFFPHDSTLFATYIPSASELEYGGTLTLFLGAREGCPNIKDSVVIDFGRRPGGVDFFIDTWLKANEGPLNSGATAATNGQAVATWFDYTDQGNDATAVVNGPILTDGAVNNNPSLVFSDDDDERMTISLTQDGDETVFAAVSQSTTSSNGYLGDNADVDRRRFYGGGTNPRHRFEGGTTIAGAENVGLNETFIGAYAVGNSSNERAWTNGTSAYDQEFGAISTTNTMLLGNRSNLGHELAGNISEVIVYDALLGRKQRHQVETYLAVKYGVTLSHKYRDADGTTLFNADGPGGVFDYDYDIGGIGQNECRMALSQPKSMSQNDDRVVQMGDPSSLDDFDYLIWGNNDTSLASRDSVDIPNYYVNERLGRIWNVDTTGDIGTVTLAFYLGNIPGSYDDVNRYALLINNGSSTMANAWTATYNRSLSNDTLYFTDVQFADNDFFTLGTPLDTDGDSIPDIDDIDDDDDGIPDTIEIASGTNPTADADRDGIPDYADPDFPGCGSVATGVCSNFDTDRDSIPDHLDLDSDDDGIADIVEAGGVDTNGNGRIDTYDDADGDGLHDPYDPTTGGDAISNGDQDGDGLPNAVDLDADNDGIPDVVETGGTDTDGDGIADNKSDSDNDGFNDVVDGDVGNDDISENFSDVQQTTGPDTDADGIPNSYPDGDTDDDGILDYLDLDADNDGIPDVVEAIGTDTNGNGVADNYVDTDNDGFNDVVDGDVGNDGVSENTANATLLTGPDTDGDGRPNSYPTDDVDGDTILNHLDLDADNDGIPDVVEAGGTDVNGDGRADDYVDADNDGFNDLVDGDPDNSLAAGDDSNDTNTDDALTTTGADTDGDGEPNSTPSDDFDGDGVHNFLDLDADGDGILDVIESGGTDVNRDGIEDAYVDADDDGYNDNVDGDPTNSLTAGDDSNGSNIGGVTIPTGDDTDGDGAPNSFPNANFDGDNHYNYLDIDADDDGIVDNTEGQSTASYIAPNGVDNDGDGIDSAYDSDDNNFSGALSSFELSDIDSVANPNTPDYLDLDTDDDGEVDTIEGHDTDGDGIADASSPANTGVSGGSSDVDNDGLLDGWDNDTSSTIATNTGLDPNDHPDYDGGTDERDWREIPCEDGIVVLSPENATTVAPDFCRDDPWTYYFDPANPDDLLFAIEHKPAGGNTNEFAATVSLTVSVDPNTEPGVYSAEDIPNKDATFVMGRYWNVSLTSGSLNGDVNIRFFYDTDDSDTLEAVALRWRDQHAQNPNLVSGRRWFTMTSGTFDPGTGDLTPPGIAGSSEIFPSTTDTEDGVTYVQFDGLSSLTGGGQAYTIGESSVILPVELLSFQANVAGSDVLVSWVTATEINSDYFIVQRSADMISWDDIGMVNAAGNSSDLLEYDLVDRNPLSGKSYYRLVQVDFDATQDISQVEEVLFDAGIAIQDISLYPNPNDGSFNIDLASEHSFETLLITTSQGQIVASIDVLDVQHNIVQLRDLAAGTYMCVLKGANGSVNLPMVITK